MTKAAVAVANLVIIANAQDDIGYADVAVALNQQIKASDDYLNCVFCGGPGILIRSPDGYENDGAKLVVPATFWTNDLFAPSQIYPSGDPGCPSENLDCPEDPVTGERGPWNNVQLGMVIGSAMGNVWPDFDNIQAADWGWGVFYPTDSNAVDGRCRWLSSENGFDCPKGWQPWGEDFQYNEDFTGAGAYAQGNPYAGGGGGGAGCHFNSDFNGSPNQDQINGEDDSGTKLVEDADCQCNYELLENAGDWVNHWIQYGGYVGPSSAMDVGACWVNNPRDMIKLQNELFWRVMDWNDGSCPWARWGDGSDPASQRPYWGWNEIPVDSATVSDPANWDAVMLKLPAMLSGDGTEDRLSMLSWGQGVDLEGSMSVYIDKGLVVPGSDQVSNRPGSSVAIVREWMDSTGNYQREFFCESWTSPNNYFRILFFADTGACFVEWGATKSTKAVHQPLSRKARHNSSTHGVSERTSAIAV